MGFLDEAYVLTSEGYNHALAVLGEFCQGFTIEEIARNGEFTEDEIKTMMFVLMTGYAEAFDLEIYENKESI